MESKLNFDFRTTQDIIQKISAIDLFKGKWIAIENKGNRYLKELKRIATIESIGSSTRIEGVTLTDEEIAILIKNVKITQFKTRDEEEVFGYYEALDIIFENHENIELTENNIKNLHGILLKFSTKDQRHKGQYKSLSNQVVANYPDGLQRIIFRTTEPHLTEKEMHELVAWVNEQLANHEIHPLIVIGVFVYQFLSIHPFQDGNGRLSRLLTTLLALREGYPFIQYVSFENIIEHRKKEYYTALMSAQQHRGTEKEILSAWLIFFLDCIGLLIQKLEAKYALFNVKANYLNDRQNLIKAFIQDRQSAKLSDIVNALPQFPLYTLKKDLSLMVQQGILSKMGERRGTVYLIKPLDKLN